MIALVLASARLIYRKSSAEPTTEHTMARRSKGMQVTQIEWPPLPEVAFRLGVDPTLSLVGNPVQFGLFATADIAVNVPILWYGGRLRHKDEMERNGRSHVRKVFNSDYVLDGTVYARLFDRPVPTTQAELDACIATAVPLPDDAEVRASPVGYFMNTTSTRSNLNVGVQFRLVNGLLLPYLVTTKPVRAGDQFLCPYNNVASNAHGSTIVEL